MNTTAKPGTPVPESARIVIVGGGIVGCSLLYALAKNDCTDALLLERRELADGSTWHAAGNVTHFGHYADLARFHAESIELYLGAEQDSGQKIDFQQSGSIRLAASNQELSTYEALAGMYHDLGVRYEIVDNTTVTRLHPGLIIGNRFGAAHTPDDGHLDPSLAVLALARSARIKGCEIRQHCKVVGIRPGSRSGWVVETANGLIAAEHVVLATSFWTRKLTFPLGLNLPLIAMEHAEVITGNSPLIERHRGMLPAVRDPVSQANIRQEGKAFLCGVYETQPRFWAVDGVPAGFGRELLVPDLDRLLPRLEAVANLLPAFSDAGIRTVNNGPLCFTPDGKPMVGPVPGHRNLWLAAGFPVGIGTGGGAAVYLAEQITGRCPEHAIKVIDPARFPPDLALPDMLARMKAVYVAGYRMVNRQG